MRWRSGTAFARPSPLETTASGPPSRQYYSKTSAYGYLLFESSSRNSLFRSGIGRATLFNRRTVRIASKRAWPSTAKLEAKIKEQKSRFSGGFTLSGRSRATLVNRVLNRVLPLKFRNSIHQTNCDCSTSPRPLHTGRTLDSRAISL
jgi:hypothetical protein